MVDVRGLLNISERVAHFKNKKSECNERLLLAPLKKLVQPHPNHLSDWHHANTNTNTSSCLKLFWTPEDRRSTQWESGERCQMVNTTCRLNAEKSRRDDSELSNPDATYIFVMSILCGEEVRWRSSLGDRLPGGWKWMEMCYLCFCTYKWIFAFHDSNLFMKFAIC
jgi:hypothetical protein